ncbi:tape measure protein [Lactobacillus sp. ESL0228]|uniref:tape measure protein n=1 Tax=Lactobacillus sp. ESL0228 TaxID=2069352 RepID=UPI001F3E32FB|nr:tape measure protein [Lactobacillus sp. ESL0228]
MATISGTLMIKDAFSNVLNKFNSGMQRSMSAANRLKAEMNKGSAGIESMGHSANTANIGLRQLIAGSAIGSMISSAMGVASNGVRAFVGELNDSTVAWSTFEGNMRQIGKSPAQINAARSSLQKFAQDTIYSSSDMAQTYSQLAAVGVKNTTQLVKGFGGLAAAATDPQQAMKTLSEQATQMAAKPTVQWQDFKLMLEQTPAGMAAVAKTMGMSTKELVKNVQASTIKTEDFLNAVAKTGTNANFSKMATQYKTIGQALDGLKETLANKVQPQFKKLSEIGIKAISSITDKLGKVNFTNFADKIIDGINRVKTAGSAFIKGFTSQFSKNQFVDIIRDIGDSIRTLFSSLSNNQGLKGLFNGIGQGVGRFALTMANGIANVVQAISKINPSALKMLAAAFVALKLGTNGLKLAAIAAGLKIIGSLDPGQLQHVATAVTALATAFVAMKGISAITGIFGKIFSGISSFSTNLVSIISTIMTLPQKIAQIGSMIEVAFSAITWPVALVIAGITALIIGAVYAWQTNLFNFRNTISNLFSNFGSIFEPLRSAFSNLGEALAPASGVLSAIGKALGTISIGAIYGIAIGVGALADALTSIISTASAFVYSLRAAGNSVKAFGSAINDIKNGDFSFSGMRKAFSDAGNDIGHMFDSLNRAHEFKATGTVISSLKGIDAQAKTTKSNLDNIKMPDIVQQNKKINNLDNVYANKQLLKKAKVKVDYQFTDPTKLNNLKSKSIKTKIKPELDSTTDVKKLLQSKPLKAKYSTPKIPTPKVPKIKPLHAKVAKPKIPTPKTPKIKTMHAKVARPKVPQPIMPKVKTIHVKVARPKVPTPTMPKIRPIPGPRMGRAKTAEFLASVQSAISKAAAIAQSGVGPMYSAGAMIGQGLAAGMQSALGAVTTAANALVAQADRAARAKAKVHSPSRLFAEIGDYLGQGMALGMNGTQGLIASASDAMIATATPDASGIGYGYNRDAPSGNLINTRFGGNTTTSDNHSSTLTIESGAIQINSSGSAEYDADTLLAALENKIIAQQEKSLG